MKNDGCKKQHQIVPWYLLGTFIRNLSSILPSNQPSIDNQTRLKKGIFGIESQSLFEKTWLHTIT